MAFLKRGFCREAFFLEALFRVFFRVALCLDSIFPGGFFLLGGICRVSYFLDPLESIVACSLFLFGSICVSCTLCVHSAVPLVVIFVIVSYSSGMHSMVVYKYLLCTGKRRARGSLLSRVFLRLAAASSKLIVLFNIMDNSVS